MRGHVLDAVVVLPSQPQICTRLCAQMRAALAQCPGCAVSQPSPSHTPDAQSVVARQSAPSAASSTCAGEPASITGGGSGFGAGTIGAGGAGVAAGGGAAADGALALGGDDDDEHAAMHTAISQWRKRMPRAYTSRCGEQLRHAV